jgi:hypothetical protein
MADRPVMRLEPDLERRLGDVGRRVAFPATPDLAGLVSRRLAAEATERRRRPDSRWWRSRRAAVAAVLLLALVVGMVALLTAASPTLADRFGLRGVRIFLLDEEPTVEPAPVGTGLMLGRRVSLEQARREVGYAIRVPTADGLGRPDEVYLSRVPSDGMVSFVYRPRPGLPESRDSGVGALLSQFPGRTENRLAQKILGPASTLESARVKGGRAYWIAGEPHVFSYTDPSGEVRYEEYRLAESVLLWEEGELTLRLEGAMTKEEALRIAESMEALG